MSDVTRRGTITNHSVALQELRETVRRLDGGFGDPSLRLCRPSGIAALDDKLPGGGLPVGAVTECLGEFGDGRSRFMLTVLRNLLAAAPGFPAMLIERPVAVAGSTGRTATAAASRSHARWRWYPPALAQTGLELARLLVVHAGTEREALWAAEQGLRADGGLCALVLPEMTGRGLDATAVRRLQLAAEESAAVVLLPRPSSAQRVPSAAAVRLLFRAEEGGASTLATAAGSPTPASAQTQRTSIHLLRCRGGSVRGHERITVSFSLAPAAPDTTPAAQPVTVARSAASA